ncbi:hypothetical protein Pint_16919 [Pistacia integerrima]|uniref:Uncharacterized protein n=1 Tax=Pistacia integerrima TaxID=434235 RepID=A0ACC0ZBT7_9ROSI|nr:hypothetical protein Pint_16919 [Pistacia integerrima]
MPTFSLCFMGLLLLGFFTINPSFTSFLMSIPASASFLLSLNVKHNNYYDVYI